MGNSSSLFIRNEASRVKIKNKLIFLLLAATVALSVVYSRELYLLYITTYYTRIKKETLDTSLANARKLYAKEKYGELESYIERLQVMYPDNTELKRLQGFSAIKLGRRLEGARIVVRTLAPGEDIANIAGIVEIFYEEEQYADIVDLLARRNLSGDRYLIQIYGAALFHEKDCARAVHQLTEAIRLGAGDLNIRLYRGLCLEETGRLDEAIADIEEAYRMDPVRKDVQQALVRAYRKARRFEQAERLIRRGMR